jgi:hypothetical protein
VNPIIPGPSSSDTGVIYELVVSVDLMRRGYEVFRAVSHASSCDLIVRRLSDGFLLRVEVTTGYRRKNGELGWVRHDESRYDLLAVVVDGALIFYMPPLDGKDRLLVTSAANREKAKAEQAEVKRLKRERANTRRRKRAG